MTVTVQDASVKCLERLYEIEKECFVEEAFTKKQIALLLTDYNSISLTASENEEIVGFIVGMVYPDGKAVNGHILTIDVSPSHRRKGIGQMLLQEMESIFLQKGVQACLLEVREGNAIAISLYHKLGYEEIGRLENYYGNAHGIYLKKILA
jgi:[ribosomal protein S18]-alanine N-acetyltransferase